MKYRQGMKIDCPHCSEESVVRRESVMDGWTKVGERFICARCRAELKPDDAVNDTGDENRSAPADNRGRDGLKAFLGTDDEERPALLDDTTPGRFCRDCKHLMVHPFKVRCILHKRDVNPMDDCDDFEPRSADEDND